MKKIALAAAISLATIASQATAKDLDFAKIYTECGLGGIIGKAFDDADTSRVIAVVTNVTWDLGTTATTSYTLSPETCANKRGRVASFINQSYEKLEEDIAKGDGKYLDTLAQMVLETKDSAKIAQYKKEIRAKFQNFVATKDYNKLSRYEKVEGLFDLAI